MWPSVCFPDGTAKAESNGVGKTGQMLIYCASETRMKLFRPLIGLHCANSNKSLILMKNKIRHDLAFKLRIGGKHIQGLNFV